MDENSMFDPLFQIVQVSFNKPRYGKLTQLIRRDHEPWFIPKDFFCHEVDPVKCGMNQLMSELVPVDFRNVYDLIGISVDDLLPCIKCDELVFAYDFACFNQREFKKRVPDVSPASPGQEDFLIASDVQVIKEPLPGRFFRNLYRKFMNPACLECFAVG